MQKISRTRTSQLVLPLLKFRHATRRPAHGHFPTIYSSNVVGSDVLSVLRPRVERVERVERVVGADSTFSKTISIT